MRATRLSDLLISITLEATRERISVDDLFQSMRDRVFGALMFVFALPNVLPAIPGTSIILGVPLALLAGQLAVGSNTPWLPQVLRRRSMTSSDFAKLVGRTVPWISRAEHLLKPRLSWLTVRQAEQLIGAICFVLAVLLVLPLPFGNILPALSICILSLAMLERDGLAALFGVLTGALAVVVVWSVLCVAAQTAMRIVSNLS